MVQKYAMLSEPPKEIPFFSEQRHARAIGLKPSRTRDYLKQLVDKGILEIEGEYKNREYKIKK